MHCLIKRDSSGNIDRVFNPIEIQRTGKDIEKSFPLLQAFKNKTFAKNVFLGRGKTPLDLRKLRGYMREAANVEVFTVYDMALQYFVSGGRISTAGIRSLMKGRGEMNARISYWRTDGSTIDQIAHYLYENQEPSGRFDTEEFRDAVEDVVLSFNSPFAMAKELLERTTEKQQEVPFDFLEEELNAAFHLLDTLSPVELAEYEAGRGIVDVQLPAQEDKETTALVTKYLQENLGIDVNIMTKEQINSELQKLGYGTLENPNLSFLVSGEKALDVNQRKLNLQIAKEMELKGVPPINIKLATGWEYNTKQKVWQEELEDPTIKKDVKVEFTSKHPYFKEPVGKLKLSDLVDLTNIKEYYPQLENVDVIVYNTDGILDDNSLFSDGTSLFINFKTNENTENTIDFSSREGDLYHEIQHIIQNIEGFERGTTPTKVGQLIIDYVNYLREGDTKNDDRTEEQRRFEPVFTEFLNREQPKAIVALKQKELPPEFFAAAHKNKFYRYTIGEIEASNVASRAAKDSEFRRNTLLEQTEIVGRDIQISMDSILGVKFLSKDDIVYGFYNPATNKIFLTEEYLNSSTLMHELWHLVIPSIRSAASSGDVQAQNILSTMQNLVDETFNEQLYIDRFNGVSETTNERMSSEAYSPREGETQDSYIQRMREEYEANLIGDNATQYFSQIAKENNLNEQETQSLFAKIQNFIKSVASWLSNKIGFNISPEEASKLPVQEVLDKITTTILKGEFLPTTPTNVDFEMFEAKRQAQSIQLEYDNEGRHLAPNGKPSKLTEAQAKLVRTPAFISWFGDFINTPELASKVLDENGEPLVVYRGTITTMIPDYAGRQFFTPNKAYAQSFTRGFGEINEFFLNIKSPVELEKFNSIAAKNNITGTQAGEGIFQISAYEIDKESPWMVPLKLLERAGEKTAVKEFKDALKTRDGFIGYDAGFYGEVMAYVIEENNQAKLADGTNTTFSSNVADVRMSSEQIKDDNSINNQVNNIINGTAIFKRFSQKEHRGFIEGGRHHVQATLLTQRFRGASEENATEWETQAENALEKYAKENSIWIRDLKKEFGEPQAIGAEAYVWFNPKSKKVTKAIGTGVQNGLDNLLDKITIHNTLFPETKLQVVGFSRDSRGDFNIIVEQSLVKGTQSTSPEIREHMTKLGFKESDDYSLENITFSNGEYILQDLHLGNVIKTPEGNLAVIDGLFYLNTPELGYGGNRVLVNEVTTIEEQSTNTITTAIQRNNGNPLNLAPNGKPSILYQSYKDLGYTDFEAESLVAQTYTDEFGEWFGKWWETETNNNKNTYNGQERKSIEEGNDFLQDFTNELRVYEGEYSSEDVFNQLRTKYPEAVLDGNEVSKVVDENGQPLLTYHGTNEDFNIFNKELLNTHFKAGDIGAGFYFTTNKEVAENYAYGSVRRKGWGIEVVKPFFINAKKIAKVDESYKLFDYFNTNDDRILARKMSEQGYDGAMEIKITGIQKPINKSQIVVFEANQIKSATENIGTFSPTNPDIRFSVIGEKGATNLDQIEEATFRMDNLRVAKKMEASGKTPKEIRLATGWEKGTDGLFRYEILDGKLKIKRQSYTGKLSDVLDNEALFNAYPLLKDMPVSLKLNGFGTGAYDSRTKEITINGGVSDMESILLHEVQHAIQDIEGFAQGGSPVSVSMDITLIMTSLKEDLNRLEKSFKVVEQNRVEFSDEYYNTKKQEIDNLRSKLNRLDSIRYDDNLSEQDKYRFLAGEVEARNVQSRMNMSTEERRQTLLQETEDVAREDQVFLMNSFEDSQMSVLSQQKNPVQITQEIIDRLKQTGLSEDVFLLSTEEIDAKLKELGVSEDVRKQVLDLVGDSNEMLVNGFYSPLEKTINETKLDKLPAKQWMDKFAKGEEAKWTGLQDWLSQQTGSVSKADIQNYLKENRIEIREVVKGVEQKISEQILEDETYNNINDELSRKGIDDNGVVDSWYYAEQNKEQKWSDVVDFLNDNNLDLDYLVEKSEINASAINDTKFSSYQLAGEKENYKEVLVTLPISKKQKIEIDRLAAEVSSAEELADIMFNNANIGFSNDALENGYSNERDKPFIAQQALALAMYQGDSYGRRQLEDKLRYFTGEENFEKARQLGADINEAYKNAQNKRKETPKGVFKSSHFDEPNILVHLRMNTRTDADGNKVLFLEEVQSDWGQQGKKEGFFEKTKMFEVKDVKSIKQEGLLWLIDFGVEYEEVGLRVSNFPTKESAIKEAVKKLNDQNDTLRGNVGGSFQIPRAPFVTDTNAWAKLGLKVALKEAVKQGVDKIAWTTGEQQNDRYDLSKQVDEITYNKLENGDYRIVVYKNGDALQRQDLKEKELESNFGKDVAEKIINDKGETNELSGVKSLSGIDLKVGGKGMKGFYGSPTEGSLGIVGNVAKSLFKQEPKTVSLAGKKGSITRTQALALVNDGKRVFTELRGEEYSLNTIGDVMEANNYYVKESESSVQSVQHSIDITPELKAQVSAGLPLFQKSLNNVGINLITNGFTYKDKNGKDVVVLNKDTADDSTSIHEFNHIFLKWMKENKPEMYNKGMELVKNELGKTINLTPTLEVIKRLNSEAYVEYDGMFSKTSTGTSKDDILNDSVSDRKGYFFYYKKQKAKIEMMSPEEYLKRVRKGFGTTMDENILESSRVNILKGIEQGDKIDMPYLDYTNGRFSQEGRNRAMLAKERGETLIPVMVLEDVSKRDLTSVSEDMLDALQEEFIFSNKQELLEAVVQQYSLHRDAENYIQNNILDKVTLSKDTKGKVEYTKKKSEIQEVIDYVKQTQPNLQGEDLYNEILTELTGRKGAELINSKKKSGIIEWIKDFFKEIGQMLGILDMSPQEVANMTLGEFAEKSAISLLKGEAIKGQQAQEYFMRNADRLPLTLAVFQRPEFVKLQGKMVNPITVLQSLNQTGIKQIEKELIKQVVENNFPEQKKISYDELEATVRANIMPLERIYTSSYSSYGMDNLGDGNYGNATTIILNSPIEHGVTGHFGGDFKASQRKNIKYIPKQLNDSTWVAVEEGYESQANNNNIYQYVGTAGTKEAVESWIENYNGAETIKVGSNISYRDFDGNIKFGEVVKESGNYLNVVNSTTNEEITIPKENVYSDKAFNKGVVNEGMFGHIRVWQDGDIFYTAELQSDFYQKNNARKTFLEKLPEYNSLKRELDDKTREIEIQKDLYLNSQVHLDILSEIEKNPRVEVKNHSLEVYDGTLDAEALWLFIDGKPILQSRFPGEGYSEDLQREGLVRNKSLKPLKDLLGEDFADNLQKFYDNKLKEFKDATKKLEKEFNLEVEKLIEKLTPLEKQFIASQKEWEKRMVRETIKEAILAEATTLRFPTPYTISVIEGYIADGAPYVNITGADYLDVGDTIEYLDEDYTVVDSDSSNIIVIKSRNVYIEEESDIIDNYVTSRVDDDWYYVENNLAAFYTEEEWLSFKEDYSGLVNTNLSDVSTEIEEGVFEINIDKVRESIYDYYDSVYKYADDLLRDMGYDNIYNSGGTYFYTDGRASTETLLQPSEYKGGSKESFSIEDDLSEEQATVASKYEQIAEILKQERINNFEVVTDANGFDWYETKLSEEEINNPVVAFRKSPLVAEKSLDEVGLSETSNLYSPEFMSWFSGSIAVDVNNNPLLFIKNSEGQYEQFSGQTDIIPVALSVQASDIKIINPFTGLNLKDVRNMKENATLDITPTQSVTKISEEMYEVMENNKSVFIGNFTEISPIIKIGKVEVTNESLVREIATTPMSENNFSLVGAKLSALVTNEVVEKVNCQ